MIKEISFWICAFLYYELLYERSSQKVTPILSNLIIWLQCFWTSVIATSTIIEGKETICFSEYHVILSCNSFYLKLLSQSGLFARYVLTSSLKLTALQMLRLCTGCPKNRTTLLNNSKQPFECFRCKYWISVLLKLLTTITIFTKLLTVYMNNLN